MIVPSSETYSDESEDEIEEIDIYRRKYQLLLERCEVLQQDNERIVNRIQQVKKLLRKSRKERKFLMDRLDRYGDNWRTAPLPVELDEPIDPPLPTVSHERTVVIPKPKVRSGKDTGAVNSGILSVNKPSTSGSDKTGSKKPVVTPSPATKRKSTKPPVDPNAPKRPANPFFQFCQEQRSIVLEQVVNSGQREPSKQELTKQLATRWNSLTTDDKKVYYDMYEKSKERYTVDMQIYSLNKGKNP